jgi:dUTPase
MWKGNHHRGSRETPHGAGLGPFNSRGTYHLPEKNSRVTIMDLFHATPRSARLDLSPFTQYILTPDVGTQAIPNGPLPEGTIGLIQGRNNITLKGIQIHPGVVDQDYTGELKILAQAPQIFVAIASQTRLHS